MSNIKPSSNSALSTPNPPPQNGKAILLVEDNEKIMSGNTRMFRRAGYDVSAASTLAEARASISKSKPDLIVLDIMLPDGSGMDFLKELRGRESGKWGNKDGKDTSPLINIPVLLLTGLAAQDNIVNGLTGGGDDYLTKPYDFPVLLARVEALLRRAERVPEKIVKGHLSLDLTASVAFLDDTDLLLSQKEFNLLLIFAQNEGRNISAEYLYEKIWKIPLADNSNALKTTIHRLRSKITNSEYFIEWSRGEGYCFRKGEKRIRQAPGVTI